MSSPVTYTISILASNYTMTIGPQTIPTQISGVAAPVQSVDGQTGAVVLGAVYAPIAHVSNTSNPHGVTAAQVGAAPEGKGVTNGDDHDHSGGDGGAISHADTTGRDAADSHPDEAIADPSVTTLIPVAGAVTINRSASARRFDMDLGSGTAISVTLGTGWTNGADFVPIDYETTGSGVTWSFPGETVYERGTAPAAAGYHRAALRRGADGNVEIIYYPERSAA